MAVQNIKIEASAEHPNRENVEEASNEVRSFLQKCVFWLGGKADKFADEFFKTLGKAAAVAASGTISVLILEIVGALQPMLKAVEHWLTFL